MSLTNINASFSNAQWTSGQTYTVNTVVWTSANGTMYPMVCLVGHVAGTLSTDVQSGYWKSGLNLKNYIINGNFDIAQRGATSGILNGGSAYQIDRFYTAAGGGGATNNNLVLSQQAVTNLSNSQFCHQIVSGTGIDGSPSPGIATALETAITTQLVNKTITVSCLVRMVTGSEAGTIGLALLSKTTADTKAAASDTAFATSATINESSLSTVTWTTLTLTATVPSTCKTLTILITESQHSSHSVAGRGFQVAQFMLNEGPAPAAFQTAGANMQAELAMCQRYYYQIGPAILGMTGPAPTTTGVYQAAKHPVIMRTSPTLSGTTGTYAINGSANSLSSSITPTGILSSPEAGMWSLTGFVSLTVGAFYQGTTSGSPTGILKADAEL